LAGDCVEEKDVAAGAADRDVIVVKTENKKKCLLLLKSLVECEEGTRKHTFIFLTLNIRNYEKSQKTSRKLNFQRLDWRNIFIAQNTLLNFELQYIPIALLLLET
jgi:hypothetical protein